MSGRGRRAAKRLLPDRLNSAYTIENIEKDLNVSRETLAQFQLFVGLLKEQNEKQNLVSARSLEDVWRRHVLDSAQLVRFLPEGAKTLVDLGSGAGFPGLVLAMLRPELHVTLIEATGKKCRFLREVANKLGLRVGVRQARIEACERQAFDAVTARACAPLSQLLGYAQIFSGPETVCLFLKGQNVGVELTEARNSWRLDRLQQHQSISDPTGTILEIRLAS